MKTLLVGNFGAKNLGDELILLAALQAYPEATVMTADSDFSQQFCETEFKTVPFPPTGFKSGLRYLLSAEYRQRVKNLNKFDRIVFAGGGLFAIKLHACWLWYVVFCWLKKLNPQAEIGFEHQGIDENLDPIASFLAKRTLRAADFVSTRDDASFLQAQSFDLLELEKRSDRFWEMPLPACENNPHSKVLVNVLDFMKPDFRQYLYKKFEQKKMLFVAFQPSDLRCVPPDWPGEVVFPQTKTELFALFVSAEMLVGERLHSLLLSNKLLGADNTFLLRNPYAEKVAVFAKFLGWKKI